MIRPTEYATTDPRAATYAALAKQIERSTILAEAEGRTLRLRAAAGEHLSSEELLRLRTLPDRLASARAALEAVTRRATVS